MNPNQLIANRYRLEKKIGEGGMGAVYSSHDTQTGLPVAVKVLTVERGDDEYQETVTRFSREGEVLRQLNHPNIVGYLDTVEEEGHRYIVMELVKGGSLAELLRRAHPLPIDRVVSIALELADALARAHHLNIVHRDIKPGNVLLAEDDTPRLTDFGIAHISGLSRVTETGQIVGTLSYICPELLRNAAPDARADIWAFGILLFELLTGTRPFDRDHAVSTIQAILIERPPDLESLRPDAPIALVDLVYRMLDKSVENRIPSMRLVGAELEAIQKGHTPALLGFRSLSMDAVAGHPTLEAAGVPPTKPQYRMPLQSTAFVGREREIEEIVALVKDPGVRLITILGPGGMGKTRLSLRVAEEVASTFQHGACFVPLAPLSSPEYIVTQITEALRQPFHERTSPRQQVIDYLHDKAMLLIMDNFEHVLEGAELLSEILAQAPRVQILATSRSRLGLQGETLYSITGMDLPEDGRETLSPRLAQEWPPVRLFIQSARRDQPNFELNGENLPWIVRICELVQGMPLAIELAAGWAEMLSVKDIAHEIEKSLDFLESDLRDVPERHRSIRAVFDYSWQLLSADERAIFCHLSIFQGGFTRDAAQTVSGANLKSLQALANKSLIRRHPDGRYEVHEVLRQYAEAELSEDERQEAKRRHSNYYAAFLAQIENDLKGGRQTDAAIAIEREIQNIRSAWQYAIQNANFAAVDQCLESLNRFYDMQSRFEEGEAAFREADQQLRSLANTNETLLILGRLLARHGWFARRLRTGNEARQVSNESLQIFHRLNARAETAFPLNTLGCIARDERNPAEAFKFISESLEVYRENRDRWGIGFTLYALGDSARMMEEWVAAIQYFEESAEVCKAIGDFNGTAWAYIGLGRIATRQGKHITARAHYEESLAYAQKMGFQAWVHIEALQLLGWLEWRYLQMFSVAQQHYEMALRIVRNYGTRRQLAEIQTDLGLVYASLNRFADAFTQFREGLNLAVSLNATDLCLKVLVSLASILSLSSLARANKLDTAVQWLAFAIHHPQVKPDIKALAEEYLNMVRLALPAGRLEKAITTGTELDPESFIPEMLAVLDEL